MSRQTGSLSPCKLQQHPGRQNLGNQDNNGKEKHPAENPSHPSLGIIMPDQLWQLITDIAHIRMSQCQTSMHKYTINSVGFKGGGLIILHKVRKTHLLKH